MQIKVRWLILSAYGFLLLPFIFFCLGFLRLTVAIPVTVLVVWIFIRLCLREQNSQVIQLKWRDLFLGIGILLIWVWLSGIGGFAFQNCDHHVRNAIFHDLVNQSWPVNYHTMLNNAVDQSVGSVYSLVYYIGFWLPAALVGKLLGWQAAEITLFVWTFIGVLITVLLIQKVIIKSFFKSTLLIIFFSGMDLIGAFVFSLSSKNIYPPLWPPITHLEWWAHNYQFSSFTTQLFWVFNQSVPAWICIALHMAAPDRKRAFLLWALCFFLSPIPSLGLLPFVILEIPAKVFNPHQLGFSRLKMHLAAYLQHIWADVRQTLSVENCMGGGVIIFVSLLYFSANRASTIIQIIPQTPLTIFLYLLFILLEFLLLWITLRKKLYRDLEWYFVGIILAAAPLIQVGTYIDFCMRASIPALFVLMVWVGREISDKKWGYRPFVIVCLTIGLLAPLYEINRSIYRTFNFLINSNYYAHQTKPSPEEAFTTFCYPERDHSNTLVADNLYSLNNIKPDELTNYIARLDGTIYQRYLLKK